MAYLDSCEHAGGGDAEVQVADHLGRRRLVDAAQLLLGQVVRVQNNRPRLRVNNGRSLLEDTNMVP